MYPAALPFPRIHTPSMYTCCMHRSACNERNCRRHGSPTPVLLSLSSLRARMRRGRKGTDLISGWERRGGRGDSLQRYNCPCRREPKERTSERDREKRSNFRLMKMKAAPLELRAPIKSKNEGGRRRADVHGIWLHEASCYSFGSQNSDPAAMDGRTHNMCKASQPRLYSWGVLHRCQTGGVRKSQLAKHGRSHNKRLESEANGKRSIEWHFFRCRDRRHLRNFSLRSHYLFLPFHHSPLLECGARLATASEQIKDERAEPNSFGVTLDSRGRRQGRALSLFDHSSSDGGYDAKFRQKMEMKVMQNQSAKSPCL